MKTINTRWMELSIEPKDINTNKHFFDTFDKQEREVSARLLVELAQDRGGWYPFTKEEVNDYCSTGDFRFNGLTDKDSQYYCIIEDKGMFFFTDKFILKVWEKNKK